MPFRGTHDQVTRDRISARLKGHPVSDRTRQRIREAKTGVPLSAEHRAAISRAKRLKWFSRETSEGIS